MFFELDEDQEQLKDLMRSFLQQESPEHTLVQRTENSLERPHDVRVFDRLCAELELVGLAIPEERGGSGAGLVELFVVFEELGRVLYGGPLLSTMLAAELIVTADTEDDFAELLGQLLAGAVRGAVAGLEWNRPSGLTASQDESGHWIVSGVSDYVFDGTDADQVVLFADSGDGVRCFLVDQPEALERSAREQLDLTRPVGRIRFDAAPVTPIGSAASAAGVRERVVAVATLCITAEQVGAARRCLEISVEHAASRTQFGRAIGSFQAVKHRCADSAVLVEAASATGLHAAWALQQDAGQQDPVVRSAKSVCSEASVKVAASTIQVLGGIGYTWEHPAHLFYRRAITSRQTMGTTWQHRDDIASQLFARG
ncbi:hypothetical protein B7R54_04280 [Subtercola boreus]|uniref:Acyl-CoA dehydrogenase n=1 Tax=Subtercola boreus TaxID=120213 RepID=A0A3E0VGG7_9MICO|nr:acyl-CoA dehydrogenase family protein [Subtercola boreus]RFA08528.1 hypothetical protein B7R54_04280 [Subtercola boreus]TQL54544.1 alkylation response protein AidB-like acyl-CoA dehydrogenase [Subtercola boreus]